MLWSLTPELLDRCGADGSAPFVAAGFKLDGFAMMRGDHSIGRVAMDAIPSRHACASAIPESETERLVEERLAAQGIAVQGQGSRRGRSGPQPSVGPPALRALRAGRLLIA